MPVTASPTDPSRQEAASSHTTRILRPVEEDDADAEDELETRSWAQTAADLPRKSPAGSSPDRRSPSRAPADDSTDTLRWMARTR